VHPCVLDPFHFSDWYKTKILDDKNFGRALYIFHKLRNRTQQCKIEYIITWKMCVWEHILSVSKFARITQRTSVSVMTNVEQFIIGSHVWISWVQFKTIFAHQRLTKSLTAGNLVASHKPQTSDIKQQQQCVANNHEWPRLRCAESNTIHLCKWYTHSVKQKH